MAERLPEDVEPALGGDLRVLVVLPTYDEAANLGDVLPGILAALPDADVLVVDDASPDGTGLLAERMAEREPRIRVMHRSGKLGLGSAYLAGFRWGLQQGFDLLIEMDADGSHPPDRLPAMVEAVRGPGTGLVIGSRWTRGGRAVGWPLGRRLLSRAGNLYVRLALGLQVRDATAGFRVFRASTLRAIDLDTVAARGYFFQVDLTVRVLDAHRSVVEVPIEFRDRERGESKMDSAVVGEAMLGVTRWALVRRWRRLRAVVFTFSGSKPRSP